MDTKVDGLTQSIKDNCNGKDDLNLYEDDNDIAQERFLISDEIGYLANEIVFLNDKEIKLYWRHHKKT